MAGRGRPKGSGKKSEFDMLDQDTQDEIARMTKEELKEMIGRVAMDSMNVKNNRDNDQDLKEKKEAASEAGKQYKEGLKRNDQRTKLAMRCLGDKGGDTQPDGEAKSS